MSLPLLTGLRTVVPDAGQGLPGAGGDGPGGPPGHVHVVVPVPRKGVVIVAVGFPDVGQRYGRSDHTGQSSPQGAHFSLVVEEASVLVTDCDGRVLNPDGVHLRGPLEATSPDLGRFSKHGVVYGRPPGGALSVGLLSVSVLLHSATSLEKIHSFRSVLIFRY